MKQEIRNAITKAIKESDLNGYKWTITENGLHWSYLSKNEQFTFGNHEEADGSANTLVVFDHLGDVFVRIWYGTDRFITDCETLTEAYYLATKKTIRQANYLY